MSSCEYAQGGFFYLHDLPWFSLKQIVYLKCILRFQIYCLKHNTKPTLSVGQSVIFSMCRIMSSADACQLFFRRT